MGNLCMAIKLGYIMYDQHVYDCWYQGLDLGLQRDQLVYLPTNHHLTFKVSKITYVAITQFFLTFIFLFICYSLFFFKGLHMYNK